MANEVTPTKDELVFQEIEKALKPILVWSEYVEYGTDSKAKGTSNNIIKFTYKGYKCIVELKV